MSCVSRDTVPPGGEDWAPLEIKLFEGSNRINRWLVPAFWVFVALGISVRLICYLVCFPLWPDEAFLAANLIDGKWLDMLGALHYHQVASLFFLWTELGIVKLLGFCEYSLRLFPFLCALVGLWVFLHIARRLLRGVPLFLAVGIFAVAFYPIRHGAEVKPYAVDLTTSLVLLALAIEWLRNPERAKWLWWLAATIPFAVGLSFPAVFVAGGISLGLLIQVRRLRLLKFGLPYGLYNLLLLGAFLVFYAVSTGPQYQAEDWLSGNAWIGTFPPLRSAGQLLIWLIETHTGRMFAYPNGSNGGGSIVTFLCFLIGSAVFFKRRRVAALALLLAPFLLTFIAAAFHRYPYGYSARFNLYLAPSICLLAGTGATRLLALIPSLKIRAGMFLAVSALLALMGVGMVVDDLLRPYKNPEDIASRDFARRFWADKSLRAELVCVKTDLGLDFFPGLYEDGSSARYLCHQRIYSPLHRLGPRRPQWEAVSESRPLRCVVFSVPETVFPYARRDGKLWGKWRRKLESRYAPAGHEKYAINAGIPDQHETYEVYDFIPK